MNKILEQFNLLSIPEQIYLLNILNEDIYGQLAIAYHRTQSLNNINAIVDSGFIAGRSAYYGMGIYLTHDLESQLTPQMEINYGEYIIKCRVNTKNVLILDYDESPKVYGDKYTLIDQLKLMGIKDYNKYKEYSEELEYKEYSSDIAKKIYYHLDREIQGISFTGRNDGRVIVIYEPYLVEPISYIKTKNGEIIKNKWKKISTEQSRERYSTALHKNWYKTNYRLKTKEDIIDWLNFMEIEKYTINDDLTVDVNGNIDLYGVELGIIPVQFGVVKGNFYCGYNNLISLKGSPRECAMFDCSNNKLMSLEESPEKIGGNFDCSYNNLISLKGSPQKIGGIYFDCNHNKLTSLQFAPEKKIKGYFDCSYNKLKVLEGFPKKVEWGFNCKFNSLTYEYLSNYDFSFVKWELETDYKDINDKWNKK